MRSLVLLCAVTLFTARLVGQTPTRGTIRGRVCYQTPTGCKAPEELIVPGEPVPKELLPDITVTRVDTGVPQPGGRSNGRGEFRILELPVAKPVQLMACGTVSVEGRKRRFCGFATGSAQENKETDAAPSLSPMTWRGKPPVSAAGGGMLQLRLIAVAYFGDSPNPRDTDDKVEFTTSIISSSNRPVEHAKVILIELDSGAVFDTRRTSNNGLYSARIEKNIDYALTVVAEGFQPANFFLYGDDRGVRMRTPEGNWGESMTVALVRPQRSFEQTAWLQQAPSNAEAMQRFRFDSETIQALPLSIRSVDQLALLAPGVFPAPETWARIGPGIAPGVGTSGQFSVNGMRSRENNFTVDGSDNNDEDVGVRRQGFVAIFPQSIESLAEFQLITALPDARFGRTIGGQVNAVSRSGGSRFHGTGYGFLADARFSARDFFDLKEDQYPAAARRLVPITTDGTFEGPRVRFDKGNLPGGIDPATLPLSLRVRDGYGFQDNPSGGANSYTRAQYGFAVGGPISRESTFFFTSFEHTAQHSLRETHFAVPTVRERGLFLSGDQGLVLPARDTSFPTTAVGAAVFSLYPFPNNPLGPYGVDTYTQQIPSNGSGNLWSAKLDRQQALLGLQHTITARYNQTGDNSVIPTVGGALFSSLRPYWRTHDAVVILSTNLRPTLANNFRISYGHTSAHFDEVRDSHLIPPKRFFPEKPLLLNAPVLLNYVKQGGPVGYAGVQASLPIGFDPEKGALGTEDFLGPVGEVQVAGFSSIGVDSFHFPQQRNQHTFQFADTLTWVRGRHSVHVGTDVRRLQFDNRVERNNRSRLSFHGLLGDCPQDLDCKPWFTALDLIAIGAPAGRFQTFGTSGFNATADDFSLRLQKTQTDFFFQDEFRWTPFFRTTFGFRFEINPLPKDLDQRLARSFDPAFTTAAVAAAFRGCGDFSQSSAEFCRQVSATLTNFLTKDLNRTFGGDRIGNDPRVAFVWDPFKRGRNAIRGGVGVYTGQFPAIVMNESRSTFPNFIPVNYSGKGEYYLGSHSVNEAARAGDLINFVVSQLGQVSLDIVQPAERFKNPYAYHAAFSVDQAVGDHYLITVSYVGTLGRKLLRISTPDGGVNRSLVLRTQIKDDPPLPVFSSFPELINYRGITVDTVSGTTLNRQFFEGTANSAYHSLQAELKGAIHRGPQFQIAFTYAHSIDDASDFFDTAGSPALSQSSLHRSERGSSSFDSRLRAVAHFVWDLSGRSKSRWLSQWFLSGIYTAQTGQPFTVNTTFDWNADGNLTDRLDNTVGLIQTPRGGDPRVVLTLAPGTDSFSLLSHRPADLDLAGNRDGAVGRNTFRGPSISSLDLALSKTFGVGEGKLEVRTEVFNLLNRVQFALPIRFLEAPAFGRSVNTIAPPRSVQFACKITF